MRVLLSTTGSCGDVERWWDSRRGGAGVRSSGLRSGWPTLVCWCRSAAGAPNGDRGDAAIAPARGRTVQQSRRGCRGCEALMATGMRQFTARSVAEKLPA